MFISQVNCNNRETYYTRTIVRKQAFGQLTFTKKALPNYIVHSVPFAGIITPFPAVYIHVFVKNLSIQLVVRMHGCISPLYGCIL